MTPAKVVILNWNGAEVLPRFLPSVVEGTPPEVEIVVADNGSTDSSRELLLRDFPSVRLIELDRNYGFAEGYNRALRELEATSSESDRAGIYILLNSDVHTPAGWCEPLLEMLSMHPDVAAVAPKLLSAADPGMFEYAGASGGFIDCLGYPFCRGRIMSTVESDRGQYDDPREVFWATGACFACRAEVFRSLGGFDASFFAHQEEIDLCWRMQLAGWKVMCEPRSAVLHLGAGTLPPSPQKLYLNYRNNLAMLYKNLPSGRMQAVVFARFILNCLSATVYLMRGERDNFGAVVRAHRDFRAMIDGRNGVDNADSAGGGTHFGESLRERRRRIRNSRIARPVGIYRGSILLRYLFGRRLFGKLL